MSAGCLVVASDTAPVREIVNGSNGLLAPIFDIDALAEKIASALAQREAHKPQREAARRLMRESYDSTRVCAPRLIELDRATGGGKNHIGEKGRMLSELTAFGQCIAHFDWTQTRPLIWAGSS